MAGPIYIIILFLTSGLVSSEGLPQLRILPSGHQEIRAGKNLVLTCRAQVPNVSLLKELRWVNPRGEEIPQDDSIADYSTRVYSEEEPGDGATSLFIKRVSPGDGGTYLCLATYADSPFKAEVEVSVFIGITWEDAPVSQYAALLQDYKVRCVVAASPPANIDWLKESAIISSGSKYVIETDGLLVREVERADAGTYTCRARVPQTGELEERDIRLDVLEPPSWLQQPSDMRGTEGDQLELKCLARGSPPPRYTWLNWNGEDATKTEGWHLNETTGTLTTQRLVKEDGGTFTCMAENNAGRIESSVALVVILKPVVEELENATYPTGGKASLTCKASGDPLPNISWRKISNNSTYTVASQSGGSRIRVEETEVEFPNNRSGERKWKQSTITIDGVRRPDDGLYECQAENEGGRFYKSGHIQVEFPPTFEDQLYDKEWSWDQRPIELTCIATAIPNATVSWWYAGAELGRSNLDKNYVIKGHGSVGSAGKRVEKSTSLTITPLSSKYYGRYTCKAENSYGVAYHEIELEEAREPSEIQQAVLDKVTATTLQFRFVPPTDIGGLPVDAFAVEYKQERDEWTQARRRVWPARDVAKGSGYILEDLRPRTTYDLRFGCKNRVGFSVWGARQQITMPRKGRPEPPVLNTDQFGEVGERGEVVELNTSNSYELSWQIPEDNGLPIDYFLLQYYPVRRDRPGVGEWKRVGDITKKEIPHRGNVRDALDLQFQDTYYKISLQAHNELGFSVPNTIIIKTKRDGRVKPDITPPSMAQASDASYVWSKPIHSTILLVLLLLAT